MKIEVLLNRSLLHNKTYNEFKFGQVGEYLLNTITACESRNSFNELIRFICDPYNFFSFIERLACESRTFFFVAEGEKHEKRRKRRRKE